MGKPAVPLKFATDCMYREMRRNLNSRLQIQFPTQINAGMRSNQKYIFKQKNTKKINRDQRTIEAKYFPAWEAKKQKNGAEFDERLLK